MIILHTAETLEALFAMGRAGTQDYIVITLLLCLPNPGRSTFYLSHESWLGRCAMTTSIFLLLCVVGEGFLVYCLVHFISESKVAMARPGGARPGARNRRILTLPESCVVKDRPAEVLRRA